MKNSLRFMMLSCLLLVMGCATNRVYTWKDVARVVEPKTPVSTPGGYLIVYTETEEVGSFDEDTYYPHTSYMIYTADGKRLKRVANHLSREDENPELVRLEPGKYVIVPDVLFKKGNVIGAVIENGKTTEVHLEQR